MRHGESVDGWCFGRHFLPRALGVKSIDHQSRKLSLAEVAKSVNAVMIATYLSNTNLKISCKLYRNSQHRPMHYGNAFTHFGILKGCASVFKTKSSRDIKSGGDKAR